jgi:hypothetical protein
MRGGADEDRPEGWSSLVSICDNSRRHAIKGAQLVAVGISEIGEIQLAGTP